MFYNHKIKHSIVIAGLLTYNVHLNVRSSTGCADIICRAQCTLLMTSLIMTTTSFSMHCRIFISENIYLFSDQFDSYHVKPNIAKIFTTHFILITKHFNLNWNIVKSLFFSQKKRLLLNEIFQICYLFQTSTLCPI